MSTSGTPLPDGSRVLRLRNKPEIEAEEGPVLDPVMFRPNKADLDDAKANGNPVRLSDWDRSRTTVQQAIEFRTSDKLQQVFELGVDDVSEVASAFEARWPPWNDRLRVVEDPKAEYCVRPGGDGHCGIEGLHRPEERKAEKAFFNTVRLELARRVKLLDPDEW